MLKDFKSICESDRAISNKLLCYFFRDFYQLAELEYRVLLA